MKKFFLPLALAVGACILSACSSSVDEEQARQAQDDEVTAVFNLKAHTKDVRVGTRDLTLEYLVNKRFGAAINQGGYKHVLAQNDLNEDSPLLSPRVKYDRTLRSEKVHFETLDLNEDPLKKLKTHKIGEHANPYYPILDDFGVGEVKDYSVYNLSRWERFCNYGLGMDKRDWDFVKKHQKEFPQELRENCAPPDLNRLKKHGLMQDVDLDVQAFGKALK